MQKTGHLFNLSFNRLFNLQFNRWFNLSIVLSFNLSRFNLSRFNLSLFKLNQHLSMNPSINCPQSIICPLLLYLILPISSSIILAHCWQQCLLLTNMNLRRLSKRLPVLMLLGGLQLCKLLRTLTRTLGGDLVLRARVVPGIGTSVGSEEGLRVA